MKRYVTNMTLPPPSFCLPSSVSLSVCLSLFVSLSLSLSLSLCLPLSVSLSLSLFCLCLPLFVCLSLSLRLIITQRQLVQIMMSVIDFILMRSHLRLLWKFMNLNSLRVLFSAWEDSYLITLLFHYIIRRCGYNISNTYMYVIIYMYMYIIIYIYM